MTCVSTTNVPGWEWVLLLPNVARKSHWTERIVVSASGSAKVVRWTSTSKDFSELLFAHFIPRASSLKIRNCMQGEGYLGYRKSDRLDYLSKITFYRLIWIASFDYHRASRPEAYGYNNQDDKPNLKKSQILKSSRGKSNFNHFTLLYFNMFQSILSKFHNRITQIHLFSAEILYFLFIYWCFVLFSFLKHNEWRQFGKLTMASLDFPFYAFVKFSFFENVAVGKRKKRVWKFEFYDSNFCLIQY